MHFSCSVMSGLALLQLVWFFTQDCCPGSHDGMSSGITSMGKAGRKGKGKGLCQCLPSLSGQPMIAPRSLVSTGSHCSARALGRWGRVLL